MYRFSSASDSDIDALKQASSNKNTKKPTLSWMTVFNNWKITHSYTKEMHTYQPEDLNPILPQVKWCAIITYKHGIYELPYELPNGLRLRILGN